MKEERFIKDFDSDYYPEISDIFISENELLINCEDRYIIGFDCNHIFEEDRSATRVIRVNNINGK